MQTERKPIPHGSIKDVQRKFIRERKEAVEHNRSLMTIDRWDLSKIFYDTRNFLDKRGYDTSPMNKQDKRKAIHNDVAGICEELKVRRHEIGIFAADRAQMAFNGEIYNVNYENLVWLKMLGTDIIFTEKEGLVNTLVPFTTDMGIALVQSGGWSSEYAILLINLVQRLDFKNIGMLTDFDSQGIGIALDYPFIVRLGVDLQTVLDLGVNLADVEEHIEPLKFNKKTKKLEENTHWVGLNNMLRRIDYTIEKRKEQRKSVDRNLLFYSSFLRDNLRYLRSNRVELGAITAAVGSERFWKWLKNKILREFPNRDYNRAITVPEILMPQDYLDFGEALGNKIKSILKPSHDEWKDKLSNYEGFVDTGDKKDEIEQDMRDNHLMIHDDIKRFVKDINKLRKKYNL